MDAELVEKLALIAVDFQGLSEKSRAETRETFKEQESNGISAIRLVLDGQIARLFLRFREKIENSNEKISYQLSLSASFIRTHFLINDLIISGDIIEALVLIRKQLENFTRLIELDETPLAKLSRKTPNVFNTLKNMGKSLYKELSEVAHFGTPRVGELINLEDIEKGKSGPSIFPVFSNRLNDVYKKHSFISIYFVFWIINFLKEIYKTDYNSSNDEMIIIEIFHLAKKEGIIIELEDEE